MEITVVKSLDETESIPLLTEKLPSDSLCDYFIYKHLLVLLYRTACYFYNRVTDKVVHFIEVNMHQFISNLNENE